MVVVALTIALAAVLLACTAMDLRSRTVPNRVVAAGAALALALFVVAAPEFLAGRLLAAFMAAGFLLVPALARSDAMGLGDVKLAGMLGLYLGYAVVTALLVAFVAGSLAGAVLFIRHGIAARRMTIPFVPYLAFGATVAAAG